MEYISKSKLMVATSLILLIGMSGLLQAGPQAGIQKSELLAIVNGDSITGSDMDRMFMATHNRLKGDDKYDYDYRKLITKLVHDRLMLQEARAVGMDQEDDFIAFLEEKRCGLARSKFARAAFKPDLTPEKSEIEKRFQDYYWKVQLRSISLRTFDEAQQMAKLIADGADMDSLANEVSLDSRRFRGGLDNLKFWVDVETVIRNNVYRLSEGELSAPVPQNDAFTIYRVEKKVDADQDDFETVRRAIELSFKNEKLFQARELFYEELAERYPILVDSAIISSIMADSGNLFNAEFLKGSDQRLLEINKFYSITDQEFRNEVSHAAMNAGNKSFSAILEIADQTIKRGLLLLTAAADGGWLDSTAVIKQVAHLGDSVLINMFLNEMIIPKIVFNREEFDLYYNEHLDDFRDLDQYQMFYLQVNTKEKAEEALARLNGGADFQYIKKLYHTDDSETLDETEWSSLEGYPQAVVKAIEELKIGDNTTLFEVADGWIIFKLRGFRQGQPKPIDKVEMKIREVMFQSKFEEILDQQLEILKKNSSIIYFEDAIGSYLGMES